MKKLLFLLLSSSLLFIGCSDGDSGGNGDGAAGYNHNELAKKFITELNLDDEFDVTMVKRNTDQYNFIVIYDPLTDTYDSININNYDPTVNSATDYYYNNSAQNFFDLDVIPKRYETRYSYEYQYTDYNDEEVYDWEPYVVEIPTKYRDRASGLVFEKTAATPKDLAKVAAIKEVAVLEKQAQFLSSQFGLSMERSEEVARLTMHWKKASLKGMTNNEQDSFSQELLGFSITEGKTAVKGSLAGSSHSIKGLINRAASQNNISPEHATKLMSKIFGL